MAEQENASPELSAPPRRDEARLQAVVNTAVDGIILIDAAGVITMFNPACETLFGYRASEVIGHNVKMLMPHPFQGGHDHYIANYLETGERKIIGIGREVLGRRKDGSTFPMNLSVGLSRESDQTFFVGIVHDVSGRKETEQQLAQAQKMESIGQLSGGIAHDFNNLLTVIMGNAETLSRRLTDQPDLQQLCDGIFAAGERGAELTRHLLAFGRRQILQPVAINCRELLCEMERLLRRTLRDDIELEIDLPGDLSWVLADQAQLESAILNLALNAQDAMPRGGSLSIGAQDAQYLPEDAPGAYVLISVRDNGRGMSADVAARAFEPFFTTKEVGRGSGLGLSMVYGFARQSSGHVAIHSEPEKGTTVQLYLPAAPTDQRVSRPRNRAGDRAAPRGDETILVVEDDPHVRTYVVGLLDRLGYSVLTAENGSQAVALLRHGARPDVLFTDIVMPGGMSGWELADQARDIVKGLRVLFTSGYPLEALESSGLVPTGAEILLKPYRKVDLAQKLRQVVDAK